MPEVRGYVLAGGQSSRMGRDKAGLRLGGLTLLELAIGKLRRICGEVAVVGQRDDAPAGVRVLPDMWEGCGPIGGMEAGLRDADGGAVLFLPVDMPFVPAALLDRMMREWVRSDARVCVAVVDGRVQPLVSMVRSEVLPEIQAALGRGDYKVAPVLERVGGACDGGRGMMRTVIATGTRDRVWPGWMPDDEAWAVRELWFANLNTPEEFEAAERSGGLVR
ncbi:MAG: hypothetical protein NVSMB3_01150 [Acidobacteriaceae bacterium]